MMRDTAQQAAYLQAMGIQAWQRRERTVVTAVEPSPVEPAAQLAAAITEHLPLPVPLPSRAPVSPRSIELPVRDFSTLNWEALRQAVTDCAACELHQTRTQTVFGVGNPQAQWMVIGEAPGADEDRQGEPFVGRAGKLLDNMLKAIGLERQQVFIANILKCRPPGNRDPRPEEVSQCEGFLHRQIALLQPRVILAVGRVAAQNLLKCNDPLARMRGKVFQYQQTPVVVTYHPAYLLRTPSDKAKAWEDLRFALRVMRGGLA